MNRMLPLDLTLTETYGKTLDVEMIQFTNLPY